jgi:AcrR family transcriptional regulator
VTSLPTENDPAERAEADVEIDTEPELDDEDLRAADGRVPGRRGRATRARLLECTAEMLHDTSYRDLKVVEIARGAGTSPATFYQYFRDVEAAILVLGEEMAADGMALSAMVRERSWKGKAGYQSASDVVDAFLEFWEEHRSLLRVVDLATLEGDQRARQVRTRFTHELTVAFSEVVEASRKEGKLPADVDPMATGGVLVSMLGQVAAHRYGFEFWGIRTDDTRRSMARVIYTAVTGAKPPSGS